MVTVELGGWLGAYPSWYQTSPGLYAGDIKIPEAWSIRLRSHSQGVPAMELRSWLPSIAAAWMNKLHAGFPGAPPEKMPTGIGKVVDVVRGDEAACFI
jgi:hypothetical protein